LKKIYLILCISFCGCSNSSKIDLQINNKVIIPKIYNVKKSNSVIVIDGIADEASWKDAQFTDDFIDIEGYIKLSKEQKKVSVSDVWRINFSRVNWDFDIINGKYSRKKENDKYLPEYNWVWSPQGKINMHIPENWGYLIFNDYEVDGSYFEFESEKINGKTIFSNFLKTKDGFTISTNFKMGVLEYSIDQSGLIKRNDI